MAKYQTGNTVTLTSTFYADDGKTPIEPDVGSAKFILYDSSYKQISSVDLGSTNKLSDGVYEYELVQSERGNFYYEFNGLFNGMPGLIRNSISFEFQ